MNGPHGELLHIGRGQGLALRRSRPRADAVEALAGQLRALADPMRLGLAAALRHGEELCVCDLSWIAERPQALTSHHMKVLKGAGIVSARKQGKMTMYSLTEDGDRLVESALGGRSGGHS